MGIKQSIKNCFSTLLGTHLLKKQFIYVKEDLEGLVISAKEMQSNFKSEKKLADDWNAVIFSNNISSDRLIDQYRKRRIISFILLAAFLFSLYFLLVGHKFFSGVAGTAVSFALYTNYALRLYQIRHCELCSWPRFFHAVKSSFKEFLPLKLPSNWQLMPDNNQEVS
jgi:hypothetical protein